MSGIAYNTGPGQGTWPGTYNYAIPGPNPGAANNNGLGYWNPGGSLGTVGGQVASLNASGAGAVGAARGAQKSAGGTASQLNSLGSAMSGQFSGNGAYAQQALTNAFDPHQDIYNRYLGQVTDQTNSQEALRGIANTPYGASVSADSLGNFNTAWNAQQIANEQMGAQTATALQQQRLNAQTAGGALIDAGGQLNLGAAQNLLTAYGIQGSDMNAALKALTEMFGIQTQASTSRAVAAMGAAHGGTPGSPPNIMQDPFNFSTNM